MRATLYTAIDVKEAEVRTQTDRVPANHRPLKKLNICLWGTMAALLVVFTIMAAVSSFQHAATTPSMTAAPQQNDSSAAPVAEGQFATCSDDEALCTVVNPLLLPDQDYRGKPRMVTSAHGVVAADQSRCSDIGVDILKAGGNAVDAAVATALCLGVVNPFASGAGGGGFIVIRLANGTATVINAREPAPAAASVNMYEGKDPNASLIGGLAIAVPLELKGMQLAWQCYGSGRVAWRNLVLPAARIARHGFAAHPYLVHTLSTSTTLDQIKSSPLMAEAFLIKDSDGGWRVPYVGELCCQRPVFASSLEQIADNGLDWLYEQQQLETLASEIQAAGGIITAADLRDAQPVEQSPLREYVGDYELLFPPPPSSAAVTALAFKILAGYTESAQGEGLLYFHRLVEALKQAFAVRTSLGDPGAPNRPFVDVAPVLRDVLNTSWVDSLRAAINDSHVLANTSYGGRWNPLLSGSGMGPEDGGTSHLSVVDAEGNAVAFTTTINTAFGSHVISPSTGLLFNNQMDDFSRPDMPNTYGLMPSRANFIAPFKRPLSSMSPTIVVQNGKLRLVVGASGGPLIISAVMQSMARLLLLEQQPLAAISRSRLHHQFLPDTVVYENFTSGAVPWIFNLATIEYLKGKGNTMTSYPNALGNSQAILVDPSTGVMTGASDPRKDGAPAAVE